MPEQHIRVTNHRRMARREMLVLCAGLTAGVATSGRALEPANALPTATSALLESARHRPAYLEYMSAYRTVDAAGHRAEAIPAFARKYNLPCSACHTAWPELNTFGQKFKDNGYQLGNDRDSPIWTNPDLLADRRPHHAAVAFERTTNQRSTTRWAGRTTRSRLSPSRDSTSRAPTS